ncbi:hypothetical protein GCM10017673_06750 [Streptosporangium violaceochromogenes]|nr:hypothetical protein GCM10017673_06750 [Streptosporangium violaceochromogenes]
MPSFGEVFFDERGQERVLRVTWHEGTLVLSLWRGEMCTASFRMPMNDVGRLVDTLDEGFVEAGGQYPDEVGEQPPAAVPGRPQEQDAFPGTGQYARPRPEDYAGRQPQPQPDQVTQVITPPEEPRPVPALSPTDVLVARGNAAPLDRSQERAPAGAAAGTTGGYGPADAVPRENMIVNDSLSYGRPQPAEPFGPGQGDPAYPASGDPAYAFPQPDSYGTPPPGRRPELYGKRSQAAQPDAYGAQSPGRHSDPYGATSPHAVDPFAVSGGRQPQPDPFAALPAQPDVLDGPPAQPDAYGAQSPGRHSDPYGATSPHAVDPFAVSGGRQPQPDPFAPPGHSTDPAGFPVQQPVYGAAPSEGYGEGYGYPASPQPDAYGRATQQPPQAGHPADLRDLYGSPSSYQGVDPSDPLGLRGQQPEPRGAHSYGQHSTGERLRPEQRYDDRHRDDRDERRDW